MPNLFSTYGRAALVALGLALAPAAFAQGTLSCPTGFTPIVVGAGNQSVEVTCGVTCPTGQVAAVTNPQSNQAAVTCSAGGGGDIAASGCSISANPGNNNANPGTATDVTLTLTCQSGTLPLAVVWSGGAPAGCPTSMPTLSEQCIVTGVSQNKTWTITSFKSAGGAGGSNSTNKSTNFTYSAGGGGGGEYALCSQYATGRVTVDTTTYPKNEFWTNTIGPMGDNDVLVFKMVVTASSGSKSLNWAPYGGSSYKEYVLSTVACDFSGATAVKNGSTKIWKTTASALTPSYSYGPAGSTTASMVQGGTYYFAVRGLSGCATGECYMYGGLK
jgi:hypothetical protein